MSVKYINLKLQYKTLEKEIMSSISRVLESGNFILGDELKNFELEIAKYCDVQYALGVGNGTDSLRIALKSLGVGKGDEVITVPNSFIATVGSIVEVGARPRFVDVGDDYNINPTLIEDAINEHTKAIMPVHLTGRPADMKIIMQIAHKYNLPVVEDAAQASGAKYHGKKVGSLGNIGSFSFHPLKNLNAYGDGGLLTTNDQELYEQIFRLRNHGLKNRNECSSFGYNSRLDELQAAILNLKLSYLDSWNETCRLIAQKYQKELSDVVEVPSDKPYEEPIYHTFIIQTDKRDDLQTYLDKQGIETKIHYPIPIHLHEAARYLGYKEGDFPNAEKQAKRILSLPIYPELTEIEVHEVIDGVKTFFRQI